MNHSTLIDRPALAITSALLGVGVLTVMDVVVKLLLRSGVPAPEIVALRTVLIVPAMLLFFSLRGQTRDLLPNRPIAQLFRALAGASAPVFVFSGINYIPLTDAIAVFFSSIFLVAILSVPVLGERVGPWRWGSIVVGYLGVFVVVNPTGGGSMLGYLLVLLGATGYAVTFVSARILGRTETVASMVFAFHMVAGLCSALALPWFWHSPSASQLGMITVVAVLALSGHFLITTAHKYAESSLVAPLEYTGVIWTIAADLLIWKEVLGMSTYVGTAIIIASGLLLAWRERLHRP